MKIPCRTLLPLVVLSLHFAGPARADDFSWDKLRAQVRALAAKPYVAPKQDLADFWKNLTYDQHRDIRFKMDSGLWAKDRVPYSIDFFHPGWTAKKTVELHEVLDGKSRPLTFDRLLFDYGQQVVPQGTPPPPGYAGWRARCLLNSQDYMDEFLVFLGASYFRAIPANSPYGLSARGLSIDSGMPGVIEEFPDFTTFYLQRPTKEDKSLKTWAVLNSESVAGSYQFTITPGRETVMEVDAELTMRRAVKQLGLAPFSSMFWFGKSTYPKPLDFRPEVHDSDGVQMELKDGTIEYRPLEQTAKQIRHCVFTLDHPRSWALVQRERAFAEYQDPEARYNERPSVRVEPLEGFDSGRLHLIEMPTTDETSDNVILLWEPQPELKAGKTLHFRYRLHWMRDNPPTPVLAVRATRFGTPTQKPNQMLVVVDFAKPLSAIPRVGDPKWDTVLAMKPIINLNQKTANVISSGLTDVSMANADDLPNAIGRGKSLHMPQVIRAFFVVEAPKFVDKIEMTCEIQDTAGKLISERWTYLWMKPVP